MGVDFSVTWWQLTDFQSVLWMKWKDLVGWPRDFAGKMAKISEEKAK